MSIVSAERLVRVSSPALDEMLGKAFPVLDSGFVRVIDYMGSDSSICQAARISYGAGTKSVSDDETLIRYLMRNYHTTPFEMCEIKLHIKIPMDAWRQMVRHRTASINEYSTRYSEAIDDAQRTAPDAWRSQSATNKQGSGGMVARWPEGWRVRPGGDLYDKTLGVPCWQVDNGKEDPMEYEAFVMECEHEPTPGDALSWLEKLQQESARDHYGYLLQFGVAREQARKDLPLSTYTEVYWKIDLHNLFHFLRLRMDAHAQLEIRSYADVIGNQIVASWVPMAWGAFRDYRLEGMTLSRSEVEALSDYVCGFGHCAEYPSAEESSSKIENRRERDDFLSKLKRLAGPWS